MTTTFMGVEAPFIEQLDGEGIPRGAFDRRPDAFVSARVLQAGGLALDYWWPQQGEIDTSKGRGFIALHQRAGDTGGLLKTAGIYLVDGLFDGAYTNAPSTDEETLRTVLPADRRASSAAGLLVVRSAQLLEVVTVPTVKSAVKYMERAAEPDDYPDYDGSRLPFGAAFLPLVIENDPLNPAATSREVFERSRKAANLVDPLRTSSF